MTAILKTNGGVAGQVFNSLTLVEYSHNTKSHIYWWMRCACGKTTVKRLLDVKKGHTKSCGCLMPSKNKELNLTHGRTNTKEFRIWCGMLQRVLNISSKDYKNYGGRGIKVCDRWLSFENFFIDMGLCPPKLSLDRKDNDGNYEPSNCRWATAKEQSNNRRPSLLTPKVRECLLTNSTLSCRAIGRLLGVTHSTVSSVRKLVDMEYK